MAQTYRVIDCRVTDAEPAEIKVVAINAEHAARLAIGEDLVRGNGSNRSLRAKVYSGEGDTLTMVRLYAQSDTREAARNRAPPKRKDSSTDW